MISSSRSKGGIVSFVIVGVLLLVMLGGAIYAVKSGVIRLGGDPAIQANDSSDTKPADDQAPKPEDQSQAEKDSLAEALKKQAEAEQKAKEQAAAAQSTPAASDSATSTAPATIPTTGVTLPTTGPRENAILSVLGISLLIGLSIAYKRSRALI